MWGSWLQKEAAGLNIHLSSEQLARFARYYEILAEKNKVMNLTAITEEKEVYIKHFYDSLTLARVVDLHTVKSLIDVGTGAGFPGIAVKIAFPHLHLVLLDSLKKRVTFLQEVVQELGLKQVECIHGRAEDLGKQQKYRQAFDLATARAVARLNVLAEYCLPFVRVGGSFVAMKGSDISEETEEARPALRILGKATLEITSFALPENRGRRHLLLMKKRKPTPGAYPRKAGIPAKQPLS